jgi:Tfp pilus assembly protein PilF
MGHTLNLVESLLAASRDFEAAGRTGAAVDLLQRLATFRQLAPEVAEEIHSRLADLFAGLEQYKKARRHLAIALTFRPQHAAYHHRMGCWIEADADAAIDRAGRYYRQAVRSEPGNAEYWADYGGYLLSAGRARSGRAAVYRAFRLSSHDVEVVSRCAAAFRDAQMWDDARRLLRRARFLHARDRRYAALWQQHQFEELCAQQQAQPESPAPRAGHPMILRFLGSEQKPANGLVDGKIIRFDSAESGGTKLPLPKRRPRKPGNRSSN